MNKQVKSFRRKLVFASFSAVIMVLCLWGGISAYKKSQPSPSPSPSYKVAVNEKEKKISPVISKEKVSPPVNTVKVSKQVRQTPPPSRKKTIATKVSRCVTPEVNLPVITAKDGFSLEEVMEITHWDKTLATTLLDECSRYKVPVSLALAVAYVESGYRQSARNRSCTGIYQINSNTAPSIKKMLQGDGRSISGTVHDARTNIILGIRYLAYLRGIMKSDEGMLVAYNRGVGGARSAYPSSSQYANDRYVKKVKRTQQNYK